MRLIDADSLIEECYKDGAYGYIDALQIAIAPTIEAEPVRHGHWISLTNCSNSGVYCSACHKKVYKEDYAWCNRKNKLRSNYCPNCGAKMDGENDEE